MLSQIASEKTLRITPAAPNPACPPRRVPALAVAHSKLLSELNRMECRFCVADAPEGGMHKALFCAAPIEAGPYCAAHARLCRRPAPDDVDAIADEVEAAVNRRP